MLDRAAPEFCLADAFHPGCEMTWPMRQAAMYEGPFRIAHVKEGWIEPEYGPAFTADMIDLPAGPIGPQALGGLTRWMAVPWQTDAASCRSGYTKAYDPHAPTFWPARVPNQVLADEDYRIVMDEVRAIEERLAAFATRLEWVRPLLADGADYTGQINNLIGDIGQMGVVETRAEPGDPRFPATLEVECRPEAGRGLLTPAADGREPAPARITSGPTNLEGAHEARCFPQSLKVFR
jgi:hypothetical protein